MLLPGGEGGCPSIVAGDGAARDGFVHIREHFVTGGVRASVTDLSVARPSVRVVHTEDALALATRLLAVHGLAGWRVVLDRARTRAGVCRPARREIGLSRVLTELHSEAEVTDTVLHEIAHALAGAEHGHDAVWRATARAIGCSGERCVPASAPRAPAAWEGRCPAGHTSTRHRRPERPVSCARCSPRFDPSALLSWRFHGQEVVMPVGYRAELAALRSGAVAPTTAPVRPAAPLPVLAVGDVVRLGGRGRLAGLVGRIEKRGRTRYHVRTAEGLVAAPFPLVEPC